MTLLAQWLSTALALYASIGLVFAVAFVTRGAQRIDPAAKAGTLGFRILILPGAAALWPLLWKRWASGATAPPVETNAHRERARRVPPEP